VHCAGARVSLSAGTLATCALHPPAAIAVTAFFRGCPSAVINSRSLALRTFDTFLSVANSAFCHVQSSSDIYWSESNTEHSTFLPVFQDKCACCTHLGSDPRVFGRPTGSMPPLSFRSSRVTTHITLIGGDWSPRRGCREPLSPLSEQITYSAGYGKAQDAELWQGNMKNGTNYLNGL
jgi:hypothetical protein